MQTVLDVHVAQFDPQAAGVAGEVAMKNPAIGAVQLPAVPVVHVLQPAARLSPHAVQALLATK